MLEYMHVPMCFKYCLWLILQLHMQSSASEAEQTFWPLSETLADPWIWSVLSNQVLYPPALLPGEILEMHFLRPASHTLN